MIWPGKKFRFLQENVSKWNNRCWPNERRWWASWRNFYFGLKIMVVKQFASSFDVVYEPKLIHHDDLMKIHLHKCDNILFQPLGPIDGPLLPPYLSLPLFLNNFFHTLFLLIELSSIGTDTWNAIGRWVENWWSKFSWWLFIWVVFRFNDWWYVCPYGYSHPYKRSHCKLIQNYLFGIF